MPMGRMVISLLVRLYLLPSLRPEAVRPFAAIGFVAPVLFFSVDIYFVVRLEVRAYMLLEFHALQTKCPSASCARGGPAVAVTYSPSGHVYNGKQHEAKAVTLALALLFVLNPTFFLCT